MNQRRPRRNRKSEAIRSLVAENQLHVRDFIYPMFIQEGQGVCQPIASMPGINRYSVDRLLEELKEVVDLGIRSICLFPNYPESKKDSLATESYQSDTFYLRALAEVKAKFPELALMTDVAMDPYSSDGHDGIVRNGEIVNDETLHILGKITETIATPRPDVKKHAPKIIMRTIPGSFIGALIGPGGKVIQELQKATGTTIVINEVDEQGVVEILGTDPDGIAAVLAKIDSLLFKPQMGEAYEVKVIKLLDFGAVVEYTAAPGNEVLLHVSELAWERTENVTDVVNMGDVFQVKYLGIDPKTRKEKVSRKALLPRPPRDENNKITPKQG
ncbi:MAG: KH domain-containing protein [Spirosomataceae bacterium]